MPKNSYEKPDDWSQKAFSEGYPARSVYKLKEIDEKFGMIKKMEEITAPNFCLSHDKGFVQEKGAVLRIYRKILARRTAGNPTINVNDFFNEDGGVKESEDSLGNNAKINL